jgi:predicted PurR-regulated permease PerM
MERSLITVRGVLLAVVVVGGVLLLLQLQSTLLIIIVALMFASALTPWVDALATRGLPRGLSVLLIALIFVLLIGFFSFVLLPVLVDQARTLISEYPILRRWAAETLRDHGAERASAQVEQLNLADLFPPQAVARAGLGVVGVVSTVVSLGLLTFYFMIDAHRVQSLVFYLLPQQQYPRARYLMHQLQRVVGGYIRGQLITSTCITVFTFVLLAVLRVPDALALATLAFFGDMVPVVGVFLIIAPTALAALKVSVSAAVIVAVALALYTQFENNVLVQRVYGSTLNLPSSAVLVGIMVGGQVLGVAGALLSLPTTAALAVLVRYWHEVHAGRDPAVERPAALSPTPAGPAA